MSTARAWDVRFKCQEQISHVSCASGNDADRHYRSGLDWPRAVPAAASVSQEVPRIVREPDVPILALNSRLSRFPKPSAPPSRPMFVWISSAELLEDPVPYYVDFGTGWRLKDGLPRSLRLRGRMRCAERSITAISRSGRASFRGSKKAYFPARARISSTAALPASSTSIEIPACSLCSRKKNSFVRNGHYRTNAKRGWRTSGPDTTENRHHACRRK